MTIVENLIQKLGRQAIATACGVDISQTYKWTYPRSRGGTDGRIPARHFQAVLTLAEQNKIEIDPWDLVGAHVKKPKRSGRKTNPAAA